MPSGGVRWATKGKTMSGTKFNYNLNTNQFEAKHEPAHQPHVWHRKEVESALLPGREVADFANKVANLSGGLASLCSLLVENQLLNEIGEKPIVNDYHAGNLHRLAVASAQSLYMLSTEFLTRAFEVHTTVGRRESIKKMLEMHGYLNSGDKPAS